MLKKIREKLKWLDPFTYVDLYLMPIVNPKKNEIITWSVYLLSAFIFAFLFYSLLGFVLATSTPMMIVVSGSMEPVFFRGDVVILQGSSPENLLGNEVEINRSLKGIPLREIAKVETSNGEVSAIKFVDGPEIEINKSGDIVVYQSNYIRGPVIHRIVGKVIAKDGIFLITKGDNNNRLDQETSISPALVDASTINGKSVFSIPLLGYVKLILFDDIQVLLFGCKNPSGICLLP